MIHSPALGMFITNMSWSVLCCIPLKISGVLCLYIYPLAFCPMNSSYLESSWTLSCFLSFESTLSFSQVTCTIAWKFSKGRKQGHQRDHSIFYKKVHRFWNQRPSVSAQITCPSAEIFSFCLYEMGMLWELNKKHRKCVVVPGTQQALSKNLFLSFSPKAIKRELLWSLF